MTDRELLELLVAKIDGIENRMDSMESRMDTMQGDIRTMQGDIKTMQGDIKTMQGDISSLKKTAYLVETDIAPKVQLLLENHTDLAKNVMIAKDIEERVGVLEFDVKMIKKMLGARAGA
ncbi:MAG: hypothetical protein J1F01_01540 [Oscillospiraceae bacterium]|nr:hypothetical protein [Oscillospiraceae bacterium]